jgi:hypothetical protein
MRKLHVQNVKLILGFIGILLLAASTTFELTLMKVRLDHLLAEIGALLFVLAVLHFMFEMRLRDEMLKEVSAAVLGNERLHGAGLEDCMMSSRDVKEPTHWETCSNLTIGVQYSPRFIEDSHWLIEKRAVAHRHTTILVMDEESPAARYLQESKTGIADVRGGVTRIRQLVDSAAKDNKGYVTIKKHDRVLRYSFIHTDEFIWIKFYTNSNERTLTPAMKIRAGTPLFEFFSADIARLRGA